MVRKVQICIRLEPEVREKIDEFVDRWAELGEKTTINAVIEAIINIGVKKYEQRLENEENEVREPKQRNKEKDERMRKILFEKEQNYRWGFG